MKTSGVFSGWIFAALFIAVPFGASGCSGDNVFGGGDFGKRDFGEKDLGEKANPFDAFAQCLTDKGAVMYGASWCPHCQNQKEMFGGSWRFIDYKECAVPNSRMQSAACSDAGVNAYPTWDFGKGNRKTGEFSLRELSQITGCAMPSEIWTGQDTN
ncbi:hypothetical protein HYU13_04785 [Candidatus Woesearchaeota archaeon]|nr:hypothetical protein [Candidatus Woesearchaeota archaeon]